MKVSKLWRTAHVYLPAPGFGEGQEVQFYRIITVRPDENRLEALIREGLSIDGRIEIIGE